MPASKGFGFKPYSPILKGLFQRYRNPSLKRGNIYCPEKDASENLRTRIKLTFFG